MQGRRRTGIRAWALFGQGGFRRGELVLNTMAPYMTVIGIAGERWNASVARNCRSRCLPLTTDVLALEDKRL